MDRAEAREHPQAYIRRILVNLSWFTSTAVAEFTLLYGLYMLQKNYVTTTISQDLTHESMLGVLILLPYAQSFLHRRVLARIFPASSGENRYWVTVMPLFLYLGNVSLLMYWYGTSLSNL